MIAEADRDLQNSKANPLIKEIIDYDFDPKVLTHRAIGVIKSSIQATKPDIVAPA